MIAQLCFHPCAYMLTLYLYCRHSVASCAYRTAKLLLQPQSACQCTPAGALDVAPATWFDGQARRSNARAASFDPIKCMGPIQVPISFGLASGEIGLPSARHASIVLLRWADELGGGGKLSCSQVATAGVWVAVFATIVDYGSIAAGQLDRCAAGVWSVTAN